MKTLLYILLFNISAISVAQDPQLFENPWYLHKINLNDTDYLPPSSFGSCRFNETPYRFGAQYCDAIDVEATFQNTELYLEDDPMFLLGFCIYQDDLNFDTKYFSVFYSSSLARNPFSYTITTTGSSKELEITNADGDIAFYSSEPLSMSEFNVTQISIYPNPVKEELILHSASKSGNLKIKIFNTAGKLLSTQKLELQNQSSIAISQLATGIYFLKIQDENGNTTIKKFIKE